MNVRNISLAGVIFAFVVIALGAWTRLVDAGLGCPDWPGCYGFVFFPTKIPDAIVSWLKSFLNTGPTSNICKFKLDLSKFDFACNIRFVKLEVLKASKSDEIGLVMLTVW